MTDDGPVPLSLEKVREILCGRAPFARLPPADLEELVSDVFARQISYRDRAVRDWRALVFVIAKNEFWRRIRRQKSQPTDIETAPLGAAEIADAPGPSDRLEAAEKVAVIKKAISQLDLEERRVLSATYFEEKSADEIAVELGRSRSHIFRVRLSALARLERLLREWREF